MNCIAIIPARAGSKRIKNKNTKNLAGKPLLAYAIETALKAQCFSEVILSTEDPLIAEIGKKWGAKVPWLRSQELATDQADVIEVVIEIIERLKNENNFSALAVMLLQPTSPFRTIQSIHRAIELFKQTKQSVVSVSLATTHPYWCKVIDEKGVMHPFVEGQISPAQFQDLPEVYQLNGLIYLSSIDNLYHNRSFYSNETQALITTSKMESIDIDTPLDWLVAETLLTPNHHEVMV